ncbi:phage tail protein [Brucella inopinata]|uniref:phage tail-collar fiber domain-containing protein n=1 Tax=Brucella inopinata TaxID=1218315 RepID=UPI000870BAA6|nr:phage tail protein [Brucella inopinata]SCD23535.1 hypothetical protein BR141012304_11114 [Brucella inopinata]
MAQNYFSIVTNIGRNKLALSAAGGAAVTITHFAIGDGNGAEVNPTAASTALVREVWRTPVESVVIDPLNPSAVLVTSIIPTSVGGWWMREFGIFDVDGDMVAVAKPVSQYKPTALEGQLEDIRYEFQIIIGETANVTMLVDPSVLLASRAWVESRKVPVVQLSLTPWVPVKSMTITAPPANPAAWDTYIIPVGATGAWTGHAQKLAEWNGQAWNITAPKDGHGIGLPDGRVFIRIGGVYVEWLASRDWVSTRKTPIGQLNSLPWLPVKSITLTAPPTTPSEGDIYVVAAGATGAWAGKAGQIAEWSSAAWRFSAPSDGHGVSLPDGRIFERIGGAYVEKVAIDAQSGKWNYAVAAGSANALTIGLDPVLSAYTAGTVVFVKITTTNTGASTLKIGSLAALPIVHDDGSALNAGDLLAGSIAALVCDGNRFIFANAQRGRLIGVQKFAGIGAWTYTPTPGTQSVVVEVQGGGGAGGGTRETGAGYVSVGSGGASGGYARSQITSGFAGVTVTVGAGGSPVNGGNGGNGGASSFGSFLSASGGGGGATAGPTGAPWLTGGGWPGNGTGGNIENSPGAPGGVSLSLTTGAANFGAPGGSSRFSGGGSPRSGGGAGVDASGFGGGGGGTASGQNWASLPGGAGAAGLVIIWEYA